MKLILFGMTQYPELLCPILSDCDIVRCVPISYVIAPK